MIKFVFLVFLVFLCGGANADTPANCTLDDLIGTWHFYIYSGGHDKTVDCTNPGQMQVMIPMTFSGVNTVEMDREKAVGNFNLIYNQGFEAIVNYRKYFAFFAWSKNGDTTSYWCDRTMHGWSHDNLGNDWACFTAVKQNKLQKNKLNSVIDSEVVVKNPLSSPMYEKMLQQPFHISKHTIDNINKQQSSWVAGYYPQLSKMTYKQVLMRSGYGNGPIVRPNLPRKLKFYSHYIELSLPESFDWRNVNGQDFVSPIRDQGNCGSCYAFASMAMLEARIRIMTNNTKTPVFSPQDVVSCSEYAQGCAGGFPYLIAGKYAQDFGVVDESCYPYTGKDSTCSPLKHCERTYVAKYEYVGGYYGGCNEAKMMQALVANGPMAVAIEVYADLQAYKGGIYHHVASGVKVPQFNGVNPFQLTNHAVLVVGYGADQKSGEKYWIVKNSWGKDWGESGYFRIRRGTDEVAIESLAMESFPIPHIQ